MASSFMFCVYLVETLGGSNRNNDELAMEKTLAMAPPPETEDHNGRPYSAQREEAKSAPTSEPACGLWTCTEASKYFWKPQSWTT